MSANNPDQVGNAYPINLDKRVEQLIIMRIMTDSVYRTAELLPFKSTHYKLANSFIFLSRSQIGKLLALVIEKKMNAPVISLPDGEDIFSNHPNKSGFLEAPALHVLLNKLTEIITFHETFMATYPSDGMEEVQLNIHFMNSLITARIWIKERIEEMKKQAN